MNWKKYVECIMICDDNPHRMSPLFPVWNRACSRSKNSATNQKPLKMILKCILREVGGPKKILRAAPYQLRTNSVLAPYPSLRTHSIPSAYNPRRKTLLDSDWSRSFWTLSLLTACLFQIELFLNYQQYKVGISANYVFPLISFVKFIVVTHRLDWKCYFIF